MIFNRQFAMPNSETFKIDPITDLLERWLMGKVLPQGSSLVIVDPFARNSNWATITNDLNPNTTAQFHLPAEEFVQNHVADGAADVVLFDPPYSPRQISECYQHIGKKCSTQDTQNARLYKRVKDGLDRMLRPEGIAICCGWNSMGFGLKRGYEMLEILLVSHGAVHNDTIVTVEKKK
jgi:hypothetical protein